MINADNFWAWLLGGLMVFCIVGIALGVFVDSQYTIIIFGGMGWFAYMLFYKMGKIEKIARDKAQKESDQWVADYMKNERIRRENEY